MPNTTRRLLAAALLSILGAVSPVLGQKDEVATEVSRPGPRPIFHPGIISRPGSYYLARNLHGGTAAPVLTILADDVTLDLRGHALLGPGGRQGTGILIDGASDVRVANGNLSRFGIGAQVVGGTNVTIEGLRIDGQDSGGAPPDVEIGILLVDTRGARVANNTVTETFLGIFVRGDGSGGNRISGNLVTGGDQGELAICYNPAPGQSGGGPHGDLVVDNVMSRYRRGLSLSLDSSGNVVRGNTIAYFDVDIQEATPGSNLILDNDTVQILP